MGSREVKLIRLITGWSIAIQLVEELAECVALPTGWEVYLATTRKLIVKYSEP